MNSVHKLNIVRRKNNVHSSIDYNWDVKSTLEDGLRALEEATELAKAIRIELTADYLRLIAQVEAMPQNQSGAGKYYVSRRALAFKASFTNARLLGRAR